jgi:hypothetical protein
MQHARLEFPSSYTSYQGWLSGRTAQEQQQALGRVDTAFKNAPSSYERLVSRVLYLTCDPWPWGKPHDAASSSIVARMLERRNWPAIFEPHRNVRRDAELVE